MSSLTVVILLNLRNNVVNEVRLYTTVGIWKIKNKYK